MALLQLGSKKNRIEEIPIESPFKLYPNPTKAFDSLAWDGNDGSLPRLTTLYSKTEMLRIVEVDVSGIMANQLDYPLLPMGDISF